MLTPHDLSMLPKGTQVSMTGDDWISDRDRKQQARAEAARKKAGLACAKKLEAAADALLDYLRACNECHDGSGNEKMAAGDGRLRMMHDLLEYAGWLDGVHGKC